MKVSKAGLLAVASMSVAMNMPSAAVADATDWKHWSYNCMNDHKDAYGVVLTPRNCWAAAKHDGEFVQIFTFTAKGRGLSQYEMREACEYPPHRIAVDGKRIDTLTDKEQIEAVVKGKTLIRQVWDQGWPYCTFRDVTVPLDGAGEIYKRLVKMAPTYLPGS